MKKDQEVNALKEKVAELEPWKARLAEAGTMLDKVAKNIESYTCNAAAGASAEESGAIITNLELLNPEAGALLYHQGVVCATSRGIFQIPHPSRVCKTGSNGINNNLHPKVIELWEVHSRWADFAPPPRCSFQIGNGGHANLHLDTPCTIPRFTIPYLSIPHLNH